MTVLKFIAIIIFLTPLFVAGQTRVEYENQKAFISSMRFCNIDEIKDTVCNRLVRQNTNLKSSSFNINNSADLITINGDFKNCNYAVDSSVGKLCMAVKVQRPVSVIYQSSARLRHSDMGWTTSYSSFVTDTLQADGIKIYAAKDSLTAQIFSGYDFEIYELSAFDKKLINTFYSKDFEADKNYFIKLKYKVGHIYNFQLRAKLQKGEAKSIKLIAISYH
jgi:hypothetical protein